MADENTLQAKILEVLDTGRTVEEIQRGLDEIGVRGCERKVERKERYSKACLESTGNPYEYQHCVTITNCPDPRDNMEETCGQWRCV